MNAHTGARTIRIETVTLSRRVLADCFAEWSRRRSTRRAGFTYTAAQIYSDDDAYQDADRLIRLACEHAAGMVPTARPTLGHPPLDFTEPQREPQAYSRVPHTALDAGGQPAPAAASPLLSRTESQLFMRLARLGDGASFIPLGEEASNAADALVEKRLAGRDEGQPEALRLSPQGLAHAERLGL